MGTIQGSVERVLVWSSGIVGDFDPRLVLRGIMIDIEVGTFIKPMMDRFGGWSREIVVEVGEAT